MSTFGFTGTGGGASNDWGGAHLATKATLPTGPSLVSSMTGWVRHSLAGTQHFSFAIWADSSGSPAALLGTTSAATHPYTDGSNQQFTLNFASPLLLSAGDYWLGVIFTDDSGSGARADVLLDGSVAPMQWSYSGTTNPFTVQDNVPWGGLSLYATYGPASSTVLGELSRSRARMLPSSVYPA